MVWGEHICEVTYDLMQRGVLKFDKSQNDHMVLTFHDSCNVARASRRADSACVADQTWAKSKTFAGHVAMTSDCRLKCRRRSYSKP